MLTRFSREKIYKAQKGRCFLCNKLLPPIKSICEPQDFPTLEHVWPKSKTGLHSWENIVLSHRKCNAQKANLFPSEEELIKLSILKNIPLNTLLPLIRVRKDFSGAASYAILLERINK